MHSTSCPGYAGTITTLQIVLNTTKNPYLNQATQKITCQNFPTPKTPLIIPVTWNLEYPPPVGLYIIHLNLRVKKCVTFLQIPLCTLKQRGLYLKAEFLANSWSFLFLTNQVITIASPRITPLPQIQDLKDLLPKEKTAVFIRNSKVALKNS